MPMKYEWSNRGIEVYWKFNNLHLGFIKKHDNGFRFHHERGFLKATDLRKIARKMDWLAMTERFM